MGDWQGDSSSHARALAVVLIVLTRRYAWLRLRLDIDGHPELEWLGKEAKDAGLPAGWTRHAAESPSRTPADRYGNLDIILETLTHF